MMPQLRPRLVSSVRGGLRAISSVPISRRAIDKLARELALAVSESSATQAGPPGDADGTPSATARARWHTTSSAPPLLAAGEPALPQLNRLCALEDWQLPAFRQAVRRLLPYFVENFPDFPERREHRKHWEFAHTALGLAQLGAIHDNATVLAVGAGHEEISYDLSTRARWVFVTDIYGSGRFSGIEGDARMLLDLDHFARCAYNRNRLVVQYMTGVDLRFESDTFDAAYSLSSIEHFGGLEAAIGALKEMHRVVKPGGIVAITTECVVNGAPQYSVPGLELFSSQNLCHLVTAVPGLIPVEDLDLSLSEATRASRLLPLRRTRAEAALAHEVYPHILLEHEGRVYTSVAIFWRKAGA